jgi:hypothetical protein
MGQAARIGRILGTTLRLERQAAPFLLQLGGYDRDPEVGRPPVDGLQRPPDLGPADHGPVPRRHLLADPVDVLFLAVRLLRADGVGILVVPKRPPDRGTTLAGSRRIGGRGLGFELTRQHPKRSWIAHERQRSAAYDGATGSATLPGDTRIGLRK